MKSHKVNYLAVGTFVVAMLVATIAAIAILSGRTGATHSYFTSYDHVSGLKVGSKVLFMGFPVGQIERIRSDRDKASGSNFLVEISALSDWSIPIDSVARIRTSGLLSAVAIDIRAGESEEMLEPGGRIQGQARVDVFAAITDAANTLRDLTESDIRPFIKNVSKYINTFGQALSKDGSALIADLAVVADKLEQRGPQLIENVYDVAERAREMLGPPNSENLSNLLADMATASRNVAELTSDERLSQTVGNIQRASANLDELLGEETVAKVRRALDDVANAARNVAALSSELIATRAKVDALLDETHGLVADARPDIAQAVGDLRHTLHTIARHIDAITYNLEGSSRNIYEFSRQIRSNPGVLLSGKAPADNATATSR